MSRIGATQDTTVVFYGDKNDWWACYAFWVFQLFGHTKARVMDGRPSQVAERKSSLTRDVPNYTPTQYVAEERADKRHRQSATRCSHMSSERSVVDVRSPEEYAGTPCHA